MATETTGVHRAPLPQGESTRTDQAELDSLQLPGPSGQSHVVGAHYNKPQGKLLFLLDSLKILMFGE